MKPLKHIIAALFVFLMVQAPSAFAVTYDEVEVKLTQPIGSDILPGGSTFQSDIKTSFIFSKLIPFVIKYTIRLAVALSVIALIFGGYQFMTAYGDTEKHQTARKTIIYAAIGLVLSITAFAIVQVITKIQFS